MCGSLEEDVLKAKALDGGWSLRFQSVQNEKYLAAR